MARANAAYYATHDPFADFTTAPEILQVFGELLGAWGRLGRVAVECTVFDVVFGPAIVGAHKLAHWQRVEEFVGQQDDRAAGQACQTVVPLGVGHRAGLDRAQAGRGLDKMDLCRAVKIGGDAGRQAQRVGHQRAAPGAGLGQNDRVCLA